MGILLLIAWPLLAVATTKWWLEAKENERKHYFVSYQMKTEGGGWLTGCMDMSWNRKATRADIQEFIRKTCVEQNAKDGMPAPVGEAAIMCIIEQPWR